MPIYEFYCDGCHMIFNFMSARVNTTARPMCPKCGKKKLSRRISMFSVARKGGGDEGEEGLDDLPFDESKMESAMAELASEADRLDENDPKQAADLMRKMFHRAGLKMGDGMQEALSRMEAGEDPDQIEQELGDTLNEDELFALSGGRYQKGPKEKPPEVDDTLYTL